MRPLSWKPAEINQEETAIGKKHNITMGSACPTRIKDQILERMEKLKFAHSGLSEAEDMVDICANIVKEEMK